MATQTGISGERILSLVMNRDGERPAALRVDIIADFVCPWSYLGWARFRDASAAFDGPLALNWFPFQLNPDMPAAGMSFDDYVRSRFGDPEALRPALDELARQGRAAGIELNFERITRIPRTLKAHALMRTAAESGVQQRVADALFRRFFEAGENIGDPDVLMAIGRQAGLEEPAVRRALESSEVLSAVAAEEQEARRAGVSGVPNFLLNKHVFVVGAQDTGQMLSAIDRAIFGDSDQQASQTHH